VAPLAHLGHQRLGLLCDVGDLVEVDVRLPLQELDGSVVVDRGRTDQNNVHLLNGRLLPLFVDKELFHQFE